jgi:hypothetical protein
MAPFAQRLHLVDPDAGVPGMPSRVSTSPTGSPWRSHHDVRAGLDGRAPPAIGFGVTLVCVIAEPTRQLLPSTAVSTTPLPTMPCDFVDTNSRRGRRVGPHRTILADRNAVVQSVEAFTSSRLNVPHQDRR